MENLEIEILHLTGKDVEEKCAELGDIKRQDNIFNLRLSLNNYLKFKDRLLLNTTISKENAHKEISIITIPFLGKINLQVDLNLYGEKSYLSLITEKTENLSFVEAMELLKKGEKVSQKRILKERPDHYFVLGDIHEHTEDDVRPIMSINNKNEIDNPTSVAAIPVNFLMNDWCLIKK